MTQPWTEEDAQQVIYDAMFSAPRCQHWAMSIPCLGCLSKVAVAALSSSDRLLPPGSEVREEWRVRFDYVDGTDGRVTTADEDEARSWERAHRGCKHGTELVGRRVITTPWSPSVPDTKERDNA